MISTSSVSCCCLNPKGLKYVIYPENIAYGVDSLDLEAHVVSDEK